MNCNYHTHTRFSDGKGEPESFVLKAIELEFQHLGFSEHAPVPFENAWSLKEGDAEEYVMVTDQLKKQYATRLSLYRSLEIDYIPGILRSFADFRKQFGLDYTIGAVHLVKKPQTLDLWFIDGPDDHSYIRGLNEIFNNNIKEAVTLYYQQQIEMLQRENPDVLGHFDKVKMHNRGRWFKPDDEWVRKLQFQLIEIARKQGTIVEINTRGLYKGRCDELFPSEQLIHRCFKEGVPLLLSSDAHSPEEIDGHFAETFLILKSIGIRKLMYFDQGVFKEYII